MPAPTGKPPAWAALVLSAPGDALIMFHHVRAYFPGRIRELLEERRHS
jgi:uncharacterized membrane protein YhhN